MPHNKLALSRASGGFSTSGGFSKRFLQSVGRHPSSVGGGKIAPLRRSPDISVVREVDRFEVMIGQCMLNYALSTRAGDVIAEAAVSHGKDPVEYVAALIAKAAQVFLEEERSRNRKRRPKKPKGE